MTKHKRPWKEAQLSELKKLAEEYPIIAVADLSGFPSALFQEIRKKLSAKAVIKVSKTRVVKMALASSKAKKELADFSEGSVAIIFTKMNPFELHAFLKKNKGKTAAKEGVIAPEDIIIHAMDTGLPPGPALSDLKAAGLKVKIQGATIAITDDAVVAKKGTPVSKGAAGALAKLDIKPIKIGLNLVAAIEGTQVYKGEVLDIDTDKVFSDFTEAYSSALNLALNIYYISPETLPLFIGKAVRDSKAVALEANILTPETTPQILAKAQRAAASIKEKVPETAPAEEAKPAAEEKPKSEEAKPAAEEAKPQESEKAKPAEGEAKPKAEGAAVAEEKSKPAEEKGDA
ncbi:MAG: 50S ribosomal protein L10 [Candidatus Diapherotrites archaeon]